jgi:heptose I phosphotransferase
MRTGYPMERSDPAHTSLKPAGDGKMWCEERFRPRLHRAGLTGFEAVMASLAGECLRALEDRENWHLQLSGTDEQPYGVYLKKHHIRTWRSRLRARLGAGPGETPGRVEAENVRALSADGIGVMNLVAYGEKLHRDGLVESFVLTEELADYTELSRFLRRRFPPCRLHGSGPRNHDLDRLIRQLAQTVRQFHAAGYNHRDLYCCHFFIKEPQRGRFEIRLIDLQRVQRRRPPIRGDLAYAMPRPMGGRRWLVKDLAQLAWSAPRDRIQCTHKMAFIRQYLGVRKLRPADKRLIREVLARQHVMERKLGIES